MNNISHLVENEQLLQDNSRSDKITAGIDIWTIIILLNNVCVSSLIGLAGIVGNIFNVIVFAHQGLKSSINICLFSMAISDTITVLILEWANICFNPFIDNLRAPVIFSDLYYVSAAWLAGSTYRITLYLTVYITAERCLCILFPLKIKTLVTPRKTKFIVVMINVANLITLIPEYSTVYLSWRFNEARNETVLGLAARSNRAETQPITFLTHVILVVVGFLSVVVLTFILVVHLRRQTQWRIQSSGDRKQRAAYSLRERRSEVLVVMVAASVVISYIPLTCVSLVTVFMPEFSIGGQLSDIFVKIWITIYIFGMTNASSNIIIYYRMNSKFKRTFQELICSVKQTKI
ncbi:tachykinin-like peptides receptor 86C [Biomphalaria glabrata]|nr:tachykinin-like peptides receptor 86C [Biomphalaria glabrata]